jgi:hypothetical protein
MASPRSTPCVFRLFSPQQGATSHHQIAVGLAAIVLLLCAGLPASAQQVRSSSAFGEKIYIQLVPLLGNLPAVSSGPQPSKIGRASCRERVS